MHTCVYIKHLSEHMWWSLGHKHITVTPHKVISVFNKTTKTAHISRFRNSSGYMFMLYVIIKHL